MAPMSAWVYGLLGIDADTSRPRAAGRQYRRRVDDLLRRLRPAGRNRQPTLLPADAS